MSKNALYLPKNSLRSTLSSTIEIAIDTAISEPIPTALNITNTTASTSSITGALVISGGIGIGNGSTTAPCINWGSSYIANLPSKNLALWDQYGNNHQYHGFGVDSAKLCYITESSGADHVFYCAASSTTRTELFRIKGNSQIIIDTSNKAATPWTAPKISFNGYANTGIYFSTDGSTYKSVGTAINGQYISYTGIAPNTGAAYFNVVNADATYMGGFNATSGSGAGYFEVNGYLVVNGSSSQTYSYGYINSSGATGAGSGTNNYSILAADRVKGSEFNAVSSKKIKTIQSSLSDSNTMTEAIDLFKSIPLSKYVYTDSQRHDSYPHYGLIAEEMPPFEIKNDSGEIVQRFEHIYTDSSQSGYVPNIYSIGIVESIDENGIASITLNNAISQDKLTTISNMENVLSYGSEDEGKTFSKLEVLKNLTIIDATHITAYITDHQSHTLLVYGTQEIIPNITKNNYFELMACVVKNLLERIEALENIS